MLSPFLPGNNYAAVTGQPVPQPGKRSKQKHQLDQAKAVLNQKLIDEYWQRTASEDLGWIKEIIDADAMVAFGTKRNTTDASPAAPATPVQEPTVKAKKQRTRALRAGKSALKVASKTQIQEVAGTTGATSEDSDLVDEILRNLASVLSERTGETIKYGMNAFANIDFPAIGKATSTLAPLVAAEARIAQALKSWQECQHLPSLDLAISQTVERKSVPGMEDVLHYLELRIATIDQNLVCAVNNREYDKMQSLVKQATALSSLSRFIDTLFPVDESTAQSG